MEQQTATPTTPADSSPAPVSMQSVLDGMDDSARAKWQLTGELPDIAPAKDDKTPDAAADPSSATPVEQVDAKPSDPSPDKPADKRAAPNRNKQLDSEITELQEKLKIRRALREELATLDVKPDAKAASSPATPTAAEWERYLAMPEAPKLANCASIEEHAAKMALFIADQRFAEHATKQRTADREQSRRAEIEQIATAAVARIQKAADADPEFRSKVDPRLLDITPASLLPDGQKPSPANVLADEIQRSEAIDQLLIHFSTDQGRLDWQRLTTSRSHAEFLRAFGRLEADLSRAASAAPAPKHVSSAPDPAHIVGSRPADVSDPIAKAIKSNDFARFERLANERDTAAAR